MITLILIMHNYYDYMPKNLVDRFHKLSAPQPQIFEVALEQSSPPLESLGGGNLI